MLFQTKILQACDGQDVLIAVCQEPSLSRWVDRLRSELAEIQRQNRATRVVLDFSAVKESDSAVLGAIVGYKNSPECRDASIRVVLNTGTILDGKFSVTKLDTVIPVYHDQEEAILNW